MFCFRFWYTLAFDENGNSGKQTLGRTGSGNAWVYGMGRVVVETSEGWRKSRSKCSMRCFNLCFLTERGAECRPKGWFYSSIYVYLQESSWSKFLSICVSLLFNFISRCGIWRAQVCWDRQHVSFWNFLQRMSPQLWTWVFRTYVSEGSRLSTFASRHKGMVTVPQRWNRLHMTCIFIRKLIITPWECFTFFEQG